MSTLSIDIFTGAYPSITNNIEIRIYKQSDDLAIVASLNHAAPHPSDTWSFPGLDRTNYLFRIFEMIGPTIVRQLGDDMNVVPASVGGVNYRATEQIEADVTVGFVSGVNTVTFDGTGGAPDWRGWDISTLDRIGLDSMRKGVDYNYNPVTAKLDLLVPGDLFGPNEWFNVDFAAQITTGTDSVPTSAPQFSTPKIINANYTVNAGMDMGGLLIVDPAGDYLEIQLPDLVTVVAGKLLNIEMRRSATDKCARIFTDTGQVIDWLQGGRNDLFICPQENLSLYKFIDPSGPTSMWRVYQPFGNWLRLGEQVVDDTISTNVYNKVYMNGAILDDLQYARFYNDYVLQLPGSQVVNFDDWATGTNKYKFSLANSSNPANAGQFHIPDRRGTFDRHTNDIRLPGDFEPESLKSHRHVTHGFGAIVGAGFNWFLSIIATNRYSQGGGTDNFGGKKGSPDTTMQTGDAGGDETRPSNIAIRKYLLV